jgi:cold shock CspA family protein
LSSIQIYTGTVEAFDDEKGFGHIQMDGSGARRFFCHYSAIAERGTNGRRSLTAGQRVTFLLKPGNKSGWQAGSVRVMR